MALLSLLIGAGVGAATALWWGGILPGGPKLGSSLEIDGWHSDWSIGSSSANPYTRARIARHGLLALRKSEAIYFSRHTDESGEVLTEACTYRVSGGDMPAHWWSITLYGPDSFLPRNSDQALSFDATGVEAFADLQPDDWYFTIAPEPVENEPWVSSRNSSQFDLTLRLYLPEAAFIDSPTNAIKPPQIRKLGCGGAS